MLEKVWRKGNPTALLVGMEIGAATMENSMGIPQKAEYRTTIMIQQFHSWACIWTKL